MDNQNLHGFYLFGLASTTPSPTSDEEKQRSRRDNANIMNALTTTLRAFENDVQQNGRYYDPVDAFVSVTKIGSSQLPSNIVFDTHRWSDDGCDGENDSDDSDDDGTDAAEVAQDEVWSASASLSSMSKKKPAKTKTTRHLPASKL